MPSKTQALNKVVLITGAARRVGAVIAQVFHANHYRVIIHYRHSKQDAEKLAQMFNQARADSACAIYADLDCFDDYEKLINAAYQQWQSLDVLIHNASTFTPTPVSSATLSQWNYLMNSNLKAPFFLSQHAAPLLKKTKGVIINIVDIHARTPMQDYPIYSIAKAGLHMLTKSLALELAPDVRVNAVAPGAVLWPENENIYSDEKKLHIIANTLLKKTISPESIAKTCLFLANEEAITGQMIAVDGGKSVLF